MEAALPVQHDNSVNQHKIIASCENLLLRTISLGSVMCSDGHALLRLFRLAAVTACIMTNCHGIVKH